MQTIDKELQLDLQIFADMVAPLPIEQVFLLDIETTGFSSEKNRIYLVGCIYYKNERLHFIQWLCDQNEDEYELLFTLSKFIRDFQYVLHYNGTSFDMPFIKKRLGLYHIASQIDLIKELDLYSMLRPFQKYLGIENLKLKSLEKLFGFDRKDTYTGGALIATYHEYIKGNDIILQKQLLLHNEEDLTGLYCCLKSNDWIRFFQAARLKKLDLQVEDLSIDITTTSIDLTIPHCSNLATVINGTCYTLKVTATTLVLTLPIVEGCFYYFLQDYRNYYYLPLEDQVIHKSLAQFVSPEHKQKTTPTNCYIKKRGTFIPLISKIETDYYVFQEKYHDPIGYLEASDTLFQNKTFLKDLLIHYLFML